MLAHPSPDQVPTADLAQPRQHEQPAVLGEPPTGKRMEVDEMSFFRVEDGKFVYFWGLEDSLNRMRQLGLIPGGEVSSGN